MCYVRYNLFATFSAIKKKIKTICRFSCVMLTVLAATIRVVERCLGFFVYVWNVAPCITANEVPQPTTIQTENRELHYYRKFSL